MADHIPVQPVAVTPPPPARKGGCRKWALGCTAAAVLVFVGITAMNIVLPGMHVRAMRSGIRPGMSVAEVVEHTRGWLSCRTYVGPRESPLHQVACGSAELEGPGEMARALTDDMKAHGLPWTMTLGYTTWGPRRVFFDVHFSADGRVERVSEVRPGRLD